jgi:hypothetical protein
MGFSKMENIIDAFLPLYKAKYLHPFEKVSSAEALREVRQSKRFQFPNISIQIETDQGVSRFHPIDISREGLSFMVTRNLSYFKRYNKHVIKLTIGTETIDLVGTYRHLTLINSKKPYYKYGIEFIEGKERIAEILFG